MGSALGALLGGSRRTARAAATAAVTTLLDDEMVEIVVAGRFRGHDAVVLLTNRGVVIANSREWDPEVVSIDDVAAMEVEGWVDRRAATLRLTDGDEVHVVDRINDTSVAERLTAAMRARA